ncbi:MAG: tetratricopeptide repeat protein [Verrucomicrobiota bacterium]|nr:tetratricopeptide repeat protein [Verrucomicrobiota bacterium]
MKRFSFLVSILFAVSVVLTTKAAGPDDEFIRAYILISEGDNLAKSAQNKSAIQKYNQALNTLNALKASNPNWKKGVIDFRISYVDKKLKTLSATSPTKPTASNTKTIPTELDPTTAQLTIDDLKRRLETLENNLILKDAKLKEALSAIPTADETKRLAKIETNLQALKDENTGLKSSIDKAAGELKKAQGGMIKAQTEANKASIELAKAKAAADEAKLKLENANERIKTVSAKVNDKQTERLQKELTKNQNDLKTTAENLKDATSANSDLEKQLKALRKTAQESDKKTQDLQKEFAKKQSQLEAASNDLTTAKSSIASLEKSLNSYEKGTVEKDLEARASSLKKELLKSQSALKETANKLDSTASTNSDLQKQLKSLQKNSKNSDKQIAQLQEDLEKSENNLKEATSQINSLTSNNSDLQKEVKNIKKGSKEKELQDYIQSIEKRLAKAERSNTKATKNTKANRSFKDVFSFRGNKRAENAQIAELQNQVKTLRARLEILDAEKVPLTDEEKNMLTEPTVATATKNSLDVMISTLPAEGAEDFKAGHAALFQDYQYAEAEKKFMHVLKLDENNPFTLGNLAMAQMEQGNYKDAQTSLNKALKQNEDDAYALMGMGILSFRQKSYESARDYLARSIKINPEDATAQHFLGSALNNLGQQKAAETALRKAVQIQPGNSKSHYNLAVVYATQKPPFLALAKFHYEKAVKAGHKRNSELEKSINTKN